jgi:hypothetical protein
VTQPDAIFAEIGAQLSRTARREVRVAGVDPVSGGCVTPAGRRDTPRAPPALRGGGGRGG